MVTVREVGTTVDFVRIVRLVSWVDPADTLSMETGDSMQCKAAGHCTLI